MKSIIPFIIRFSSSFFAILTNFIVARHLGLDIYGIYSGMLSLTFFVNIVTDWGFNSYGSQMLARLDSNFKKNNFIQQSLQIKLFLSVVFSIIYGIIVAIFFDSSLYYYLGIPIILFSFLNPEWVARGLLLPEVSSYRQLLFSLMGIVVFSILYFLKASKFFIFLFYSFNTLCSFILVFNHLKNKINLSVRDLFFNIKVNLHFLKQTTTYFYGYLFNNAVYVCGVLFLSIFSESSAAGEYASYYNLFSTLVAPVAIAYGLFAPKYHLLETEIFYKDYYQVVLSILVCGLIFYANGDVFYKIFYSSSKGFIFNNGINKLAGIVFCLYCLENMFVVKFILENNPKAYFYANLLSFILGLLCYFFFHLFKQGNVRSCFTILIIMQSALLLRSIYYSTSSLRYLKNSNILVLFILILVIFIQQFFTQSIVLRGFVSSMIAMYCVFRSFRVLKKLY